MTDSGNDFPWHKNNDLGGREYTEAEQTLIYRISAGLRGRDPFLSGKFEGAGFISRNYGMPPEGVRPRDYIPAYTKIAGFVYELAKNLQSFPFPPSIPKKSLTDWIQIVTDLPVHWVAVPIDDETSDPNRNGDLFPKALPEEDDFEMEGSLFSDHVRAERELFSDDMETGGFPVDSVKAMLDQGFLDKDGTFHADLGTKVVSLPAESIEVKIDLGELEEEEPSAPVKVGISIEPEKAKAILLHLVDRFQGLLTDEPVPAADLVHELSLLLRSSV
jgi:hypothetical protein